MLIEHETCPEIALRVMTSQVFRGGPILNDAGLNAVPLDGDGYFTEQASDTGAILVFKWNGPVRQVKTRGYEEEFVKYKANVLYDEKPHRLFIPVGTDCNLQLIDISLRKGRSWEDCTEPLPYPSTTKILNPVAWICAIGSRTRKWRARKVAEIAIAVEGLKAAPRNIRIEKY